MALEILMRLRNMVLNIRLSWENIMRCGKSGVQPASLRLKYPKYMSLTTRMRVIHSVLVMVKDFILEYLIIFQFPIFLSLSWSHVHLLLLFLLPMTLPYPENTMLGHLSVSVHVMTTC